MAHDFIQTKQEIYEELRDRLSGKITKLTNFTDRSFNYVWTQAFSEEVRELQKLALVSELAGFIDYVGGPVTEEDIENLGLEGDITAEEVNNLMKDDYLDEYVKIVGISRDSGSKSTGTVTFSTQSASTSIQEGVRVTTEGDSSDDRRAFVTTEAASTADGVTSVNDVSVESVEVGAEYDVPADTITRITNPPIGVTGVINPESTTGGEDEETNNELRDRAKNAVGGASQGGTVDGIKAYIRNTIDPVQDNDVIIEEFFEGGDGSGGDAPYVDVIVDGGLEADVLDAIEFSRPTGIRHNLVRPQVVQIGSNINLLGQDIDTTGVTGTVEDFLLELGLGEEMYSDQLIRTIMLADDDIINIDLLQTFIQSVSNEVYIYSTGTTDYRLDYTYDKVNGTSTVEDDDGVTYTEGTDYDIVDQTGDGYRETLVWDTNNAVPSGGQQFSVDYDVTVPNETLPQDYYNGDTVRDEIFTFNLGQTDSFDYDAGETSYELSFVPFAGTTTVSSTSTGTVTEGTEYQVAPLQSFATQDVISFVSGTNEYSLSEEYIFADNAVIDADGIIYEEGVDYQFIDTDGDGQDDTIDWSLAGATPADGVNFTVNYNAHAKSIRWDQNQTTPNQDETFDVTYDQSLYQTNLEIVETPDDIIRDGSGDLYNEDTEYETVDADRDNENDAIFWTTNPASLNDGEEFYFTYNTEGDIPFNDREKGDPGTIDVTVE